VQMDVDQVIRTNTDQLVHLLKRELEISESEHEDELHRKSLIQLFIEHRIYKKIEDCETYQAVQKAVLRGLTPYRQQLVRDIAPEDVEMLLALPIKRISKFDLQKNIEEKAKIVQELKEIRKNLQRLIPFTIAYLEELITKYGKTYKRRTKLTEAEAIDVRELTAEELPIVYDKERGFLGSEVKGEAAFRCSPLDRLMLVWENGRYQMIPPPERVFVDKDLLYFGIYDRDRVFTVVYSTSKATFLKRFAFGGAIMNRDYSCTQEGAKVRFITDKPIKELRLKYRHTKGARIDEQTFAASDIIVRGPKARGLQVTKRTVTSVIGR
jgi:topoisomerase IV subunit A